MYVAIRESVFVVWVLVNFFLLKGSSQGEQSFQVTDYFYL